MLATSGTIVYLPLKQRDTLPKGGFALSAYGNKLGRTPGALQFFKLAWISVTE